MWGRDKNIRLSKILPLVAVNSSTIVNMNGLFHYVFSGVWGGVYIVGKHGEWRLPIIFLPSKYTLTQIKS